MILFPRRNQPCGVRLNLFGDGFAETISTALQDVNPLSTLPPPKGGKFPRGNCSSRHSRACRACAERKAQNLSDTPDQRDRAGERRGPTDTIGRIVMARVQQALARRSS